MPSWVCACGLQCHDCYDWDDLALWAAVGYSVSWLLGYLLFFVFYYIYVGIEYP